MPGVYALGDYDIAGFIVGSVEASAIIDGSRVQAGDVLLAMPSSGLHTNGYSLVRHIVAEHERSGPTSCRARTARWSTSCSSRTAATSRRFASFAPSQRYAPWPTSPAAG